MSSMISYIVGAVSNLLFPSLPRESEILREIPSCGAKEWKEHLNLDIQEPVIPQELQNALETPCPFWPNKLVKETHILCLIPNSITPKKFYEMASDQRSYSQEIPTQQPANPYWVLITKYPVPETFHLDFEKQKELLAGYKYEAPSMLEAVAAVIAAKMLANISIYPNTALSTRCKEEFRYMRVTIGGDPSVPFFTYLDNSYGAIGMAGVRH